MLHEPEQTIALCSDATKRFLLAAKHAEITVLEQLSSNCRIVIAVRELIHELQKERGASNIFLASKAFPNRSHNLFKIISSGHLGPRWPPRIDFLSIL